MLRYYRNEKSCSQEQLAEGICSREYVSLVEKNKKIPTLYMVAAFSSRLGINLFDAYALILQHNDFETHKRIEILNDAISRHDDRSLFELASEYALLPGFSSGIPLQCIKHAFSLYYANVLRDYEKAVACASEGLAVSGRPGPEMQPTPMLSIVDLCLLLAKSVNLCRIRRFDEGRKYLEYLQECARLRIVQNYYIANRNRRFDINLFAVTTFNICEFFPDDAVHNMKILEKAIRLLRDYECSNMQSELLLYKARYLYDLGDCPAAKNCFCAGYYLLACRYSREDADEEALDILGDSRFAALRQA